MAYLNYGASSWKDSREDSKSRSPLRRPSCLQSATQDKERRQSQRTSGFQVAGAPEFLPARLAEYNEGDLPKYVSTDWNVEVRLSELDELGCDPASLNNLLYVNKLIQNLRTTQFFCSLCA